MTVELPAEAIRRLEAEAERRGISIHEVITEPDCELLDEAPSCGHRLSFVGIVAPGDKHPIAVRCERAELVERKLAEGI